MFWIVRRRSFRPRPVLDEVTFTTMYECSWIEEYHKTIETYSSIQDMMKAHPEFTKKGVEGCLKGTQKTHLGWRIRKTRRGI